MEIAQLINSVDSYNNIESIDFGETIVFIKFGTEWCLPCKQLEQTLIHMSNSITYTVDVENDDFEEFLSKNRIHNIPTTIIKYKNNKTQFVGLRTPDQINSMIHNLKTLYPSND
jgi:thiol-disulfide isomerase/thioredoxin